MPESDGCSTDPHPDKRPVDVKPISSNQELNTYHVFGDLWIEDPEFYLSRDEMVKLQKLRPYIDDLALRWNSLWNSEENLQGTYETQFEAMAKAETTAWARRGVSRDSRFLIPPSGSLGAPIACHLHCPSFSVANPFLQKTDDESNICVKQIIDVGFSSKVCLIYDHLCRREALDGLKLYPKDIIDIHERFTMGLRKEMSAIVDICWGIPVQNRMMQLCKLTSLDLWGVYKGVTIYFEWDQRVKNGSQEAERSIVRFIVFVRHPQSMLYGRRRTLGALQDLHLSVAAKLARVEIDRVFYQETHKPGTYGRLAVWQWKQQQCFNASSIREVASVTPATSDELLEGTAATSDWNFDNFFDFKDSEDGPSEDVDEADDMSLKAGSGFLEHPRLQLLPEVGNPTQSKALNHLASSLVAAGADLGLALLIIGLGASASFEETQPSHWGQIPIELRSWLQNQDGLRIDRTPIDTTESLLRTHRLLCQGNKQPVKGIEKHGVLEIALDVAVRFLLNVEGIRFRQSTVAHLVIPGLPPRNIMPRVCGLCKQKVLDDAHARYKKLEPDRYVLRFMRGGCGLPGCPASTENVWAVPADTRIKTVMGGKKPLQTRPREST